MEPIPQLSKTQKIIVTLLILTLLCGTSLSYRNESTDLQNILMDLFLYDRELPHETVKIADFQVYIHQFFAFLKTTNKIAHCMKNEVFH